MTLDFILKNFNYLWWAPFLRHYELSWILRGWRFQIYPWLRYFPTRPRTFGWREPSLAAEIASSALPELAALATLRPQALNLDVTSVVLSEALSFLYCLILSCFKAVRKSHTRIKKRMGIYFRRKINQLIWLGVVAPTSWVIALSLANFARFVWHLVLLWGGVVKYGILAAINL
jgi:hypothetical protein